VSQDSTDTASGSGTTASTHQNQQCPGSRCLPPVQRHHGHQSTAHQLPVSGGHMIGWLP
jgi:hypothetical protein